MHDQHFIVRQLIAERLAEAEATRLARHRHEPAHPNAVRRAVGGWLIELGESIAAVRAPRRAN